MKMKKLVLILCVLSICLSGCSWLETPNYSNLDTDEYLRKISALETSIDELYRKHSDSEKEYRDKLEALSAEIKVLRESESETEALPDISIPENNYIYKLDGNVAMLTGYSGKDEMLVIPSHIDGYKVLSIGESAFEASKLTTVIVSEGVESIGWFAFYNSPFLRNVTIPPSVTKIGYSAFEGCSSSLTIYCQRDSYAYSYAKSYGIAYVLV